MLVRLAYWNCAEAHWGKDRDLFVSMAVPIMQQHDGFVEARLLAIPNSPRRIAFTAWRDRAAHEEFAASLDLERITAAFEPMYVHGERPNAETFEVIAAGCTAGR